jgi:hypothetical protein
MISAYLAQTMLVDDITKEKKNPSSCIRVKTAARRIVVVWWWPYVASLSDVALLPRRRRIKTEVVV